MRMKFVRLTAHKEILSTWRDRKTFLATLLMPAILIPLMVLGLPLLVGNLYGSTKTQVQTIGVKADTPLPDRLQNLLENPQDHTAGLQIRPSQNPLKDVQSGRFEAVLVPEVQDGNGQIQVYWRQNSLKSLSGVIQKVHQAVDAYNAQQADRKLQHLGLTVQDLTSITLKDVDASNEAEKKSGQFAFLIPLLILTYLLQGGQPTAVDSTAGEKERGTLEVLLVTPVVKVEALMGKFLSIWAFSAISATSSMVGLWLTGMLNHLPAVQKWQHQAAGALTQSFGGSLSLTPPSVLALTVVALSVGMLLSVLQLCVALQARSYKEAQTYLLPISLLIMLASIGLQFADFFTVHPWVYLTPIAGAALSILEVVRGSLHWPHVLQAAASHLLSGTLVFWLALKTFQREQVIFRN